jgi:RNA-directed DNA polymerase
MSQALTWQPVSPELQKVAERARNEPDGRFHSLAHLIDEMALRRAVGRQRANAAVGVDGITKERYEQNLTGNLKDLLERLKAKRYRHQPIRRVHIPKDNGKTRPLGISAFEDKVVQDAIREVMQAVYEQDFLDCSYGFRPKRSAHDAIRALHRCADRGECNWILEADIVSFFDSVDRTALREMLQKRLADGSLLRLIGKCLHVGVLDGAEFSTPDVGTAQGSILSPLLGNIYLHDALDEWFETVVRPRLRGRATLIRYADDFVIGFELREDADRVWDVLPKRMGRFGLSLHPDKTRLLDFRRPPRDQQSGKGPSSFDFLGFTLYWRRTLRCRWRLGCQTRRARLHRAMSSVSEWCRDHRHDSLAVQHAGLRSRFQGHLNYFGVNGNLRSVARLHDHTIRSWVKWLSRRSQRARLTWDRVKLLLERYPIPPPKIVVSIW